MALKLRIKRMTRRTRCHVPGCKNRNAVKVSRRDDVNGNPLFLCPDCIRDINTAYKSMESEERARKAEANKKIEDLTVELLGKKQGDSK